MHEIGRAAVLIVMFHKVQPGAEMVTLGGQNHGADPAARNCSE